MSYNKAMTYTFAHTNFNVIDLDKSIAFYDQALGLKEKRRKVAEDGSYIIVFLSDGVSPFELELTYLASWDKDKYDLGDEEFHLAFKCSDIEEAKAKHKAMGCLAMENEKMGVYFITDPDGYWIEIVPERR